MEIIFDCKFKFDDLNVLVIVLFDGIIKVWDINILIVVYIFSGNEGVIFVFFWVLGKIFFYYNLV